MTLPKSCCAPCPDVETVQIPGPEGPSDPGTNGTDGIDAFTQTTADFIVPAIGANVTIVVVESGWMVVGQPVFIEGAGIFEVVSIASQTSVTLKYLDYSINTHSTETISTGAKVSPSGNEPSNTLLPAIVDYETADSQALTPTPTQLIGLSVTLSETRSYLLVAQIRLDFEVATFEANRTATVKLRRTNNTPGDIANTPQSIETGVVTLEVSTKAVVALPPVVYSASAGDIIQLFGSVDVAPYSGALAAIDGSIVAIPLF